MNESVISPRIAIGLVIVSVLSLIAFFALSAYAPDFRIENEADAHALSRTAVGYAGLRILLEEDGVASTLDRGSRDPGQPLPSLVILTPPPGTDAKTLLDAALPGNDSQPRLLILPKWLALADPAAFGRVVKGGTVNAKTLGEMFKSLAPKTEIKRGLRTQPAALKPYGRWTVPVPEHLAPVDTLQTISGPDWVPLIVSREGGTVLAQLKGSNLVVLSEPDLMNNHGLKELGNAALALAIVKTLRKGGEPMAFDLTLNGMGKSPSLLREMFAAPFLGATLCAIFAAMMIGFHAAVRFGSPPRRGPVYARGKTALVSNSADMIRMLHREPRMATRYALTTRNLVAGALGIRRQASAQEEDVFRGLEKVDAARFAELLSEAQRVDSRGALLGLARKLYDWRQGTIHAR